MLGNFQLRSGVVSSVSSQLLGLRGKIKNKLLTFMLDSGASCNFISYDLLRTLGFNCTFANQYSVRLANGGMLSTVGEVQLCVKFGSFRYTGMFYVLNCDVPLILGMQFFSKVKPFIDWGQKTVHVIERGKFKKLWCVNLEGDKATGDLKTSASVSVGCDNSFAGLQVDVCGEDISDDTLGSNDVSDLVVTPVSSKTCKQVCRSCSRVLSGYKGSIDPIC